MTSNIRALSFGKAELDAIENLRTRAALQPLDVAAVAREAETPEGMARVMQAMSSLSLDIPYGYRVTFSIDIQPCGLCRHMSVSVGDAQQRLIPHPGAVQALATVFGFVGDLESWMLWEEAAAEGVRHAHVLQPLAVMEEATA